MVGVEEIGRDRRNLGRHVRREIGLVGLQQRTAHAPDDVALRIVLLGLDALHQHARAGGDGLDLDSRLLGEGVEDEIVQGAVVGGIDDELLLRLRTVHSGEEGGAKSQRREAQLAQREARKARAGPPLALTEGFSCHGPLSLDRAGSAAKSVPRCWRARPGFSKRAVAGIQNYTLGLSTLGTHSNSDRMMRLAILDDYQAVALSMADWRSLGPTVEIDVVKEPLRGIEAAAARLADHEILIAMRERTPFPRALLERLPKLKLLVTTGH